MRFLVVSAMDVEAKAMERALVEAGYSRGFVPGLYNKGKNTVHLHTVGIGKVNAAMNTVVALTKVSPDFVISQGCCAGVQGLEVGEVFAVTTCYQYDFSLEPIGYRQGEIPINGENVQGFASNGACCSMKRGIMMTADKFCLGKEDFEDLITGYDVVGADMETAAIAQVCYALGDKFVGIRGVSDVIGSATQADDYSKNEIIACINAAKSVVKWIDCANCTK